MEKMFKWKLSYAILGVVNLITAFIFGGVLKYVAHSGAIEY